jgi:hypothetical protein
MGAEEHVGAEEDLAIRWDRPDHGLGVRGGAAIVRQRLDLGRRVHVRHDNRTRVLGAPHAQLIGVDGGGERTARLEVGQEYRLLRRKDRGRLGHEVDPAEDDHRGVGPRRLLRETERIAHEVGDVLDLWPLIVVRQDHRVALLPQLLDPVQESGPALCRNVSLCCDHPATCHPFRGLCGFRSD